MQQYAILYVPKIRATQVHCVTHAYVNNSKKQTNKQKPKQNKSKNQEKGVFFRPRMRKAGNAFKSMKCYCLLAGNRPRGA